MIARKERPRPWVLLTAVCMAAVCVLGGLWSPSRELAVLVCASVLALLFTAAVVLLVLRRMTFDIACVLLMAAGTALRIAYVLYTGYDERQHDVWFVTSEKGHMGYIQYIAEHLSLPQTNAVWQFYHPPLHHSIAGLFYRWMTASGAAAAEAAEGLQLLTAFYSCAALVAGERLLWHGGVRRWGRVVGVAVLAFHPTTLLFAGSLNNDGLLFLLSLMTLVFFVKWWQEPRLSYLLQTAVCLGLSMCAKTSGVLLALPIAVAFCARLWGVRRQEPLLRSALRDMLLFGAVSVPIGMWHPVRNLILFGQPLFYVPAVADAEQQIGHIPFADRLWDVPWEQLVSPYQSLSESYNIPLSALKTSLFGEWDFGGGVMPYVLLAAAVVLCVAAVWEGIARCIRPHLLRRSVAGLLGLVCATVAGSYLVFCFAYPTICTQDFRYLAVLLAPLSVFLGARAERLCSSAGRWAAARGAALLLAVVAFCLASAWVYLSATAI